MDNNPFDQLKQQLQQQLHHDVHHAVDEAIASPMAVNRSVGEAMRHIGTMLEMQSTAYLPLRHDEILVEPAKMPGSENEAVLIVARQVHTENGFLVFANANTQGKQRFIDLTAYKPDIFDLRKTKFLKLPDQIRIELLRQFGVLMAGDGNAVFQVVIASNYFKNEVAEDPLFNSDTSISSLPAVTEPSAGDEVVVSGGLPEPSNDGLL
jgi:hypothetical protein